MIKLVVLVVFGDVPVTLEIKDGLDLLFYMNLPADCLDLFDVEFSIVYDHPARHKQ